MLTGRLALPALGDGASAPRPAEPPAAEALRLAMRNYPTGVTIVTACGAHGEPVGLTVNSFTCVSLEPALILCCIQRDRPSAKAFRRGAAFNVHLLSAAQGPLAMRFATAGVRKFGSASPLRSANGAPLLPGAAALLQCIVVRRHAAGDHDIVVGRVLAVERADTPPLTYHRREFAELQHANRDDGD